MGLYHNKIKEIRKIKGFTLEEVAQKANISVGYLSHLERGTRKNPSVKIMYNIACALESTILKVFFDE